MGAIFIDNVRKHHLLSGYPEEEYTINIPNPCFTGDMKLLTSQGYKTFVELCDSDFDGISFDGSTTKGKVWKSGTKKIFEVTYGNKKTKKVIRCTGNHVFMLADGTEESAENLEGKIIKHFIGQPIPYNQEFIKLGFIQGDGQLTELSSKNGVTINLGKADEDVKSLFNVTDDDLGSRKRSFFTTKFTSQLKELRVVEVVSSERRMPIRYSLLNYVEKASFLRGLFSANGSVTKADGDSTRITFKTTSKILAEQLSEVLIEFGINSYITVNAEKSTTFSNGEYICKESYDLNIADVFSRINFYNNIGFVQQYKEQKLLNDIANKFTKVYSVVDTGQYEDVYDFTEPKNHWGVVNNVVVHNCAEFYGNSWNACNLGSVNLYTLVTKPFTKDADIDWEKLKENVQLGVIALDEILDYGREMQPLEENKKCLDDWRSIGLGVFGLGDALIALGIKYGSGESIELIDKLMSFVSRTALETSADLAAEKGTFGKYNWEYVKKSPIIDELKKTDFALYKKIEANGLRNGSLLSIAPNGSIATMCGLSGGVEPLFAISYQRTTHSLSGEKKYFKVFAKSVEDLLKYNFYSQTMTDEEIIERFPFVTISHEIDPHDRIAVQSVMQKYVDNAISSTINLKEEVTVQDVFDIYMDAWESGCKGITVFRNNCLRTAILVTNDSKQLKEDTKQENDKPFEFDSVIPFKAKEVDELDGKRFVKHTACVPSMYINITHKDGNIYEVFTNAGSGCHSNISTITRLASLAFRLGGKVKEVTKEMKANQCPACIVLKQKGDKSISNSCGSAIAEAVEKMYDILQQNPNAVFVPNDFVPVVNKSTTIEYMECPECRERTLRPEAKCFNCSNCGYSRCE